MVQHKSFIRDFIQDGQKVLGGFSALLSIGGALAKASGLAMDVLKDVSYAWALLPLVVWLIVAYIGRWRAYYEHVEGARPEALTLTPITAHAIADYLLNESSWGWKKRLAVTLDSSVKWAVPTEMRRAARASDIRFIGVPPNSATAIEIDRAYWAYASIDDLRIWDSRNAFFTTTYLAGGQSSSVRNLIHYQYGSAPRIDVMRTWPRVSKLFKLYVSFRIWTRIKRYGIKAPSSYRAEARAQGEELEDGDLNMQSDPQQNAKDRLIELRSTGIAHRNKLVTDTPQLVAWVAVYEAWRIDVLNSAAVLSSGLKSLLERLDQMEPIPQNLTTYNSEHHRLVNMMSEILKRLQSYIEKEVHDGRW